MAATGALCLFGALAMAIADLLGVPPLRYFPGSPFGIWAVFLMAAVVAAVPVMLVLRILKDSLGATERWIRELRASEDALRRERDLVSRLMETSPVGIMAFNQGGEITFANASAERIHGLSRDEITQRTYNTPDWRITRHDASPYPEEELAFWQVRSTGRAVRDVRMAVSRPDGERVLLSINAAPVLTPEGRFEGMVATVEDITERIHREEELRKHREHLGDLVRQRTEEAVAARDEAVAANRAKSAFLANMSHELRTPLHAILGFTSLVREASGLSKEHRRDLDIVQRSGEHLLQLIDDVLDMAKIEAGSRQLEIGPCDLWGIVQEVTDIIRVRADEKHLELAVDKAAGFLRYIRLDAAKLRQVLTNLLANAVQYTDRGSVALRMSTRCEADSDRMELTFEVEDTGIGIAEEDRGRIFDAFVQVGGSRKGAGTGLGLTITRQFVALMGGSISVERARGRGSLFRVVVPAIAAEASEVAGLTASRVSAVTLAPGQPEYRVLVVEDDTESRVFLERLLRNAGFRARSARDGAQGLALFRRWRPHFIWIDLYTPVLDGLAATRRIRAMDGGREVKIAAVTASVSGDDREAAMAAGVDDFVRKPFRADEIFDRLARHLNVRYLNRPGAAVDWNEWESASLQALAKLPGNMREELRNGVISLDVNRIARVIRLVSDYDATLGAALAQRADRFAYTEILNALEYPAGGGVERGL